MSTPASHDPAELAARVRTVPGVTSVFAPRPTLAQIPQVLAAATATADDGPVADLLISTDAEGTVTVSTRIATSAQDSSVETARRVADALLAQTPESAEIVLQVARIR